MKWTNGFPTVSTMALMVHPRDHDLVIGTHGRAAYILDDIRPLRSISEDLLATPLHLFEIPPVIQHEVKQTSGYHFPGDAMFRGDNKPYGAMITYVANVTPQRNEKDGGRPEVSAGTSRASTKDTAYVDVEVLDQSGALIRTFRGPAEKGINRISWDLRMDGWKYPTLRERERPGRFRPRGPEVLPGTYTVRLKADEREVSGTVVVKPDPRMEISMDSRRAKLEMQQTVGQRLELVAEAVNRIQQVRKAIQLVMDQTKGAKDSVSKDLRSQGEQLRKKLSTVADLFIYDSEEVQGITRDPNTVSSRLSGVMGSLGSSWDEPNDTQRTYFRQAEELLGKALEEFNAVFSSDVPAYSSLVGADRLKLFPEELTLSLDWVDTSKDDDE
jgi:hypothetical protein